MLCECKLPTSLSYTSRPFRLYTRAILRAQRHRHRCGLYGIMIMFIALYDFPQSPFLSVRSLLTISNQMPHLHVEQKYDAEF